MGTNTTMEGGLFSVGPVVEDFVRQQGIDMVSQKVDEAAMRRYEAAGWLRKIVGVVGGKDLPAQPSEDEFRLALRSGRILCNALNKVQPGAVPKVIESPCDPLLIPDGAALTAYQYFENIRNFLVTVQELGLPTFLASDLEQGGKSSRLVNCILALKSYSEWKQAGGTGSWKYGGNLKSVSSGKFFVLKNPDPFTNSLSKKSSDTELNLNGNLGHNSSEMTGHSLNILVRDLLSNKKPEEVPTLVESMLGKVVEEFEHRLAKQNELVKTALKDLPVSNGNDDNKFVPQITSDEMKSKEEDVPQINEEEPPVKTEENFHQKYIHREELKIRTAKQERLFDIQQREIEELRHTLHSAKAGMQVMQMNYHEEINNLGKYLNGLADAASRYQQVFEENRKLYNQIQDLKGNIRVYCRVRPFLPGQPNRTSTVDSLDEGSLSIMIPAKYGKEGRRTFRFNKAFGPSATQEEVFRDTQALIRSVLDGYNVCIFAYGQTGSGKTHTMSGPKVLTEQSQGVNYRALGDLFHLAEQRKDTIHYNISVQMIEIYNEQVRDLLALDGVNKRLEIRNTSQKGLNVPDANVMPVSSTSDVIDLMNLGQKNRAVSSTALNDRSSRSHSCLTVHVQGKDLTSGAVLRGSMHLVDLAGSERVDKSEVIGDRLKEAQHINKSLSALGDVISSLSHKNAHVPYRNSKLTQLLQDSLGGQAKTLMFVHISPEPDAIGETISTLKFAERVASVELGAAKVNKDGGGDVRELKEQIASLKEALAKKEAEPQSFQQRSRSISPERYRRKAGGSSPYRQVGGNKSDDNGRRQLEDLVNIEVRSNSGSRSNRQSPDPRERLRSPSPCPPSNRRGLDDRELGDWVDKVIVKEGDVDGEEQWGEDGQLPQLFYQRHLTDSTKMFPDHLFNRFTASQKDNRFDAASTDGSEDFDVATSDSSEPDLVWQFNLPTRIANGTGSKIKKPQSKLSRSPEHSTLRRSSIPSLIPSPSRKLSNGVAPPPQRKPGSADGKRKTPNRSKSTV